MSKVSKKRKCTSIEPEEDSEPEVTAPLDPDESVEQAKKALRNAWLYADVCSAMKSHEKNSVAFLCNSLYKRVDIEMLTDELEDHSPKLYKIMRKVQLKGNHLYDTWFDLMHFYFATPELKKLWHDYCVQWTAERQCDCMDKTGKHERKRIKLGEKFLHLLDSSPETDRIRDILNK